MNNKLIAIIPAAGTGSRLFPFPCPKELFPIGYQDIIIDGKKQKRPKVISQYLIENIINAGVEKFYFILGEGKSKIMDYYGSGLRFGIKISYLYQEELFGMPYALNLVLPWEKDATVVFGMPDTIIEPRNYFKQLLNFHNKHNSDLTLGLFKTDFPSKFGMTAVDNENNVIYTIDKPIKTELIYAWGSACWSNKFTLLINEFLSIKKTVNKEVVLGDIFNYAIEKKLQVKALIIENAQYIDIGTSEELDLALKKFHL